MLTYRISYVNTAAGDNMIVDKSVWYSGANNETLENKYNAANQHQYAVRPIVTLNADTELVNTNTIKRFYPAFGEADTNNNPIFKVWSIK